MDVREFLTSVKSKPMFFVMYCSSSDLRPVYVKVFSDAHGGKITYRESPPEGKQPRLIGAKPVYVIMDWEPGIKKPNPKYMNVNVPTLLLYTKKGTPSSAVLEAYKNQVVVIPELTGEQVTTLLKKEALPDGLIDFLKDHTGTTQEALLLGRQMKELAADLTISLEECFNVYYKKYLQDRNQDEEPTEFLQAIAMHNYKLVFYYLYMQRGNELFVFAALLNWIEEIIKFCSCTGDYWNDAGLVAVKYKLFQQARYNRIPFLQLIALYHTGLRSMQSIKINEADPASCLEVFVCHIIQTLG